MLLPEIQAYPELCGYIPVRTDMRVVLPAPLGPRKPNISPAYSCSESGFSATFSFVPLSVGYFLLSWRMTKGDCLRAGWATISTCSRTDSSTQSLFIDQVYISPISIDWFLLLSSTSYSIRLSFLRLEPRQDRHLWMRTGRWATPYSCCTASLSQIEKRYTRNQQQRMAKHVVTSLSMLKMDRQHYLSSAHAIPRWNTILLRAKGGQSMRRKGKVRGKGKTTVQMVTPIKVLKIDKMYPMIVAVLELSMNIWKKLVIETCAMAHPTKVTQMIAGEVIVKQVIWRTQAPTRYMMREQRRVRRKLTMKKLTQYSLTFSPFIFMISSWRSSFSETAMQSSKGSKRESPSGYSPDPITLIILLTKLLSSPEKGIYMKDPAMIYLLLASWRQGRVILSMSDIIPSVTCRQVLIVVVIDVFTTILVTPLFLWYSGRRKSFTPNPTTSDCLFASFIFTIPSGISVFRSSPRSKLSLSALSKQAMTASLTDSFRTKLGVSLSPGHTSFICRSMMRAAHFQAAGSDQQQQISSQESAREDLAQLARRGRLKGWGYSNVFTAPVVMPATICRTASVKSRQITGETTWQTLEQQFLDCRVTLLQNNPLRVDPASEWGLPLEPLQKSSLLMGSALVSSKPSLFIPANIMINKIQNNNN